MTEIVEADEHLMEFMKAQVRERRAVIGSTAPGERNADTTQTDAFTMLVKANEDEGGKFKLNDEELVRWTFLQAFFFFFGTLLSLRCRLAMSLLCCLLVMVANRLLAFRNSFKLWLVMIETTAHSLAATLGLLALNNDVQDEIFQHIISVVGYDHAPVCVNDDSSTLWILIHQVFRFSTITQNLTKF